MKINAFATLHSRLALALFASFLLIGAFAATLLVFSSRAYQQEVTQRMHRDLATHVVDHYLLFENGEPNLAEAEHTFHDLMILGPNFEFYVLDSTGKILAYSAEPGSVKREAVSLQPIERYLGESRLDRPVYGDDPRGLKREKVFTAAPIVIDGTVHGYLYVILGSEIFDRISDLVWTSEIIQWGLLVFGGGLLLGLLATLYLTGLITRPLTRLNQQVQQVRASGLSKDPLKDEALIGPFTIWQQHSPNEIHALGCAFKQALEKIREQYQSIVTIDELRKELLSHVSHDLRTPLASLLGYLETWELNQADISAQQSRQYIATAKKNAQRIASLVEQLFELAHLDSGNVQVNLERFAIAELVQDVLQKFRIAADERGVSLKVTPQDGSIKVRGDIEKLDRVFTNLVENALRHTKPGGAITVRLNNRGSLVAIEVVDNGIGIPDQDIPHIFEPHYKAGNTVRGNSAHGGLGLAITKRLLELHQSTICVRSEVNKGTTFAFALGTAD